MKTHTEIASEILGYLSSRPEKSDTIDGITTWLLRLDKGRAVADEVGRALDLLVEKGDVELIKERRDIVLYRIKSGKALSDS
jgi:hypothetical protein